MLAASKCAGNRDGLNSAVAMRMWGGALAVSRTMGKRHREPIRKADCIFSTRFLSTNIFFEANRSILRIMHHL